VREIASLLQKAERYLRSAELLLKEGDYESSVSRTYYAMFYCAQGMLLSKKLSFSSHKGVISAFGEHFVKADVVPREMGRELNRAFQMRHIGDYGHTSVISAEQAREMLTSGQKFSDNIAQYLTEHNLL
jgi:uncharacterized protein (UPF0332 family)